MTSRDPRELLRVPVVVAPMGGGPSTPELVRAAGDAGALAFLAAGYKTAEAMCAEIDRVRAAGGGPFGVNLFVPGTPTEDRSGLATYLGALAEDAEALACSLGDPEWDDDGWEDKISALLERPPAVVSFTFGCPDRDLVGHVRERGAQVWVTVTQPTEAATAAAAGADALCVQGPEAGAHRGTFPENTVRPNESGLLGIVREVTTITDLPLLAAGGIVDGEGVRSALSAGAVAAVCGTAFLRCPESGAQPLHKAALADPRFTRTEVTRAFSGRPARGLVNQFMLDHPNAPAAYPEINNATRPLRAAASARGDAHRMSLWAGTGWRAATERSAGEIVEALSSR